MRLLIVTQAVDLDNPVLGFFHRWIEELAKRCERVEVVCLYEGRHTLPENVSVHSLGKEHGSVSRLRYALRFLRLSVCGPLSYDRVFVHMNPEYLVLAGWWWRLTGKKSLLWYSHRNVDLKLRIATLFAGAVASSSATSFRLNTRTLHLLGHGIDTDYFRPAQNAPHEGFRIVSVGRITPIKRLETAIEALALVRKSGMNASLTLIGGPVSKSDEAYERRLKELCRERSLTDAVEFRGAAPYGSIAEVYRTHDVSLNLAPSGGLDKAVLESFACGVPALVSNDGFADFLGRYRDRLLFKQDDAEDLAKKLSALAGAADTQEVAAYVRAQVVERASLQKLVPQLLALLV